MAELFSVPFPYRLAYPGDLASSLILDFDHMRLTSTLQPSPIFTSHTHHTSSKAVQ